MPYIKIIRPINLIFVIITTLFGSLYQKANMLNGYVIFAFLSAAIITAAGYVVNDYFDRNIDKINRPDRMIPAGKISPYSAYLYAMFLFIVGLSLSFFTAKFACVAMAFINTILLFFYAKKYKNGFLLGNIIVAYAAASTFVYGAFVTNNIKNIIAVSVIAFLFTLIREFIKDAQDYEGDKKMNARTIAVVWGRKKTVLASIYVVILLFITLLVLYKMRFFSLKSAVLLFVLVILPVFLVLKDLLKKINDRNFKVTSHFLKFEMLLVLIVFLVGR